MNGYTKELDRIVLDAVNKAGTGKKYLLTSEITELAEPIWEKSIYAKKYKINSIRVGHSMRRLGARLTHTRNGNGWEI
jgi:hypothetical protein